MKEMAERQLEHVDLVLLPTQSENMQEPTEQDMHVYLPSVVSTA